MSTGTGVGSRTRRVERHAAAVLRAVSAQPRAEFRARRAWNNGLLLRYGAPWLVAEADTGTLARHRGIADSLGLRLAHSDPHTHGLHLPDAPFAALVFDVLEHLRCESLAPITWTGTRANLNAAFMEWSWQAEGQNVAESSLGLLLYTVTHMARARLLREGIQDEQIETTLEETRARISRHIGTHLAALRDSCTSQSTFAPVAAELARIVDDLAGNPEQKKRSASNVARRTGLTIPAGWSEGDGTNLHDSAGTPLPVDTPPSLPDADLQTLGGYHVWSTDFDTEVTGASLLSNRLGNQLREQLDRHVASQAVSVTQLAFRLQRLLGTPVVDGWNAASDDGLIDPSRLTQIVAQPGNPHVYRNQRHAVHSPAVVSFVVDQSGSMKRQRFETVAVLVDTFCRALERAGATSEVLGFSTGDWNGGRARQNWDAAGRPADPGRLAEVMHVVYKDADQRTVRARRGMAAMIDSRHFREGVDGEALIWAWQRLIARPEPRKLLVFISDGSPFETATANANTDTFLNEHLTAVAERISRDRRLQFGAIGVDLEMSPFVANSVNLDLSGTLSRANYDVLETLFG